MARAWIAATEDSFAPRPTRRTKRTRYLEGIKRARKHWQTWQAGYGYKEQKEPSSKTLRKDLLSWLDGDEINSLEEAKNILRDPDSTANRRRYAQWLLSSMENTGKKRRKNFGMFRSTRPGLWKDRLWDERNRAPKSRRINDRMDEQEKEYIQQAYEKEAC